LYQWYMMSPSPFDLLFKGALIARIWFKKNNLLMLLHISMAL
jgi:hypothetical protein